MQAKEFRLKAIDAIVKGNPLVIEMLPEADDLGQENVLDQGMRGKVTDVRMENGFGDDPMYIVKVDMQDFVDYNRPYEQANWYYSGKEEKLGTARETGNWPADNTDDIWFGPTDELDKYIKIVDDVPSELYTEYQETGYEGGYIEWLEIQVAHLRRVAVEKDRYIDDIIADKPLQLRER